MPMNRSRVRTSEARIIDRQANARAEHEQQQRAEQAERAPVDRDARDRDHGQQHDVLRERADPGAGRLAEHDPEPRDRRREQPLELADVTLPDDAEAEEDRHEQSRLRHHAGREVGAVVVVAAAQHMVAPQRGAEDEQPEERLDRPREDVEVVVVKLAQLGPRHRGRAVAEPRGAHRQTVRGVKRAGANACGLRGHP